MKTVRVKICGTAKEILSEKIITLNMLNRKF